MMKEITRIIKCPDCSRDYDVTNHIESYDEKDAGNMSGIPLMCGIPLAQGPVWCPCGWTEPSEAHNKRLEEYGHKCNEEKK